MSTSTILAVVGTLLLLGALSNRLSSKANMPILVAFLAIGILARSFGFVPDDVLGGDTSRIVNMLGTVAMCFILYSGGLKTNYSSIRSVLFPASMLASFGVVVTALILGLSSYFISGIFDESPGLAWCLLLGALVSSTDASAVMAILRGRGSVLKGRLQPLLEFESGGNDPAAYLLTITMIGILRSGIKPSFWDVTWEIVSGVGWGLSMGTLLGIAFGVAGQWVYNFASKKRLLEYEGLYFVIGISLVLLTFGVTEKYFGANGLMAVYICGITMGNIRFNFKKSLTQFNDGVSWLMQVSLFTVLGFLVRPRALIEPKIYITGIILSLLLIFIARPFAVWLCMIGGGFTVRERLLVSWVGLRGAAPIMLATFPLAANIVNSQELFNFVFFVVLTSIAVQGSTLMPLAKWLGLCRPASEHRRPPLEFEITESGGDSEMFEFTVSQGSALVGMAVAELGLPAGVLILLIRRDEKFFPPRGSTTVKSGDGLLIMGRSAVMREVAEKFFPDTDYRPVQTFDEIVRQMPEGRLMRSLGRRRRKLGL